MNRPAKYVEGAYWVSKRGVFQNPYLTMFIGKKRICEVEAINATPGSYICDIIHPEINCLNIEAESLENAMDTAEMRYLLCL